MPAALMMAALRAYLHGAGAARQGSPCALVEAINRLVCESVEANRFVTLFYGLYDGTARELEYVNAGHHPPVVLRPRNGRWQRSRLDAAGLALGLMPDAKYESRHVTLEPGDLLVAFTDGISDAVSPDGDEWGEDRLFAILEANHWRIAREIADAVLVGADEFAEGAPQFDDMTLVVARVM